MKKLIALLMAIVMCLGLFAACGNNEASVEDPAQNTPAPEQEQAEASDTPVEIELWYYWEGETQQAALNAALEKYHASQSEYVISAKYIPFADFKKQLTIGAVAEELPDIVILDSPDHASYASMGVFSDITGKIDVSGYYQGPVDSCTYDGKLYGVPFGVNCLALYYNQDMLDAADVEVPTTWSELKEAAAKLTDGTTYGFGFCSVQNEEGTFNFMPNVWSAGADYENFNNEQGIAALTYVQDLITSGSMSKECINWTQGDVLNQFMSGNLAMMINGPWQIPTLRSEADGLNWGVSLIPMCDDGEYASTIGGENFAVVEGGNVEGALDFLNYMTAEDVVIEWMNSIGYIAPIEDIAASQFAGDEIYEVFVEQMKYANARGPHEEWPSISDAISLAFNKVMTGEATPADAAAEAQETIDSILN